MRRINRIRFKLGPAAKVGLVVAVAVAAVSLGSSDAFASATGTSNLPWETPLQTLETSIQGPVAYGLSLLGIVGAGGMLVFGGEVSEFTRRLMYLVLVVGVIVGAGSLMSTLFSSAALVG